MGAAATNNVLTALVTVKLEVILNQCEQLTVDTMGKTII
jgi:hypothetical protein